MKIGAVYECAHCGEPMTSEKRPARCSTCGYSFGEPGTEYKPPMTLSEQHERINNKKEHFAAILNLPNEKALAILNDALNIIETMSAKKVKASDIRYLVQMGIKIGQIATKYDEFIQAGGMHGPELVANEGETNEPKKTSSGAEPS